MGEGVGGKSELAYLDGRSPGRVAARRRAVMRRK